MSAAIKVGFGPEPREICAARRWQVFKITDRDSGVEPYEVGDDLLFDLDEPWWQGEGHYVGQFYSDPPGRFQAIGPMSAKTVKSFEDQDVRAFTPYRVRHWQRPL